MFCRIPTAYNLELKVGKIRFKLRVLDKYNMFLKTKNMFLFNALLVQDLVLDSFFKTVYKL